VFCIHRMNCRSVALVRAHSPLCVREWPRECRRRGGSMYSWCVLGENLPGDYDIFLREKDREIESLLGTIF
jgi:hypothetical protein